MRISDWSSDVCSSDLLGGAAANVGVALAWAGHDVRVCCAVGDDPAGDWLLDQARAHGLDVGFVQRRPQATAEVLLLLGPGGERTILTVDAPEPLDPSPDLLSVDVDCLFVNSNRPGAAPFMARALERALVVAPVPRTRVRS